VNRLRPKLTDIPGLRVFMFPMQDVRSGARSSDSSYQYTLWSPDYQELATYAPRVYEKVRTLPEIVDVSTDREQSGLQVNVVTDRLAAARLGVKMQDIETALNNAFAQRQISTLYYTQRNQYPRHPRDRPAIPARSERPLAHLRARRQRRAGPAQRCHQGAARAAALVINHQGQFPSATISFSLAPEVTIDEATVAFDRAVAELHLPETAARRIPG